MLARSSSNAWKNCWPRWRPGPRILVTHYPVWLADGRPEHAFHGLRDLDDLISVARRGGVVLWLHGHRHEHYHHPHSERTPFPVICAGSATQHGCWSYSDYTLSGPRLRAVQRVFVEAEGAFRDEQRLRVGFADGTHSITPSYPGSAREREKEFHPRPRRTSMWRTLVVCSFLLLPSLAVRRLTHPKRR